MTAVSEIPKIDARLLGSKTGQVKAARQIHFAATNVGFFYLVNHSIEAAVIQQVFGASKQFFALDPEIKASVRVDKKQRGWMAEGMSTMRNAATHDRKEVFFWGPEYSDDVISLCANKALIAGNKWPHDTCPVLRSSILPYYNLICDIARNLLQAIAIGFDVHETFFENRYKLPLARGQLVYYPPSESRNHGVAPHTDFGMITLLLQDDNGGLKVQTHDKQWLDVPPVTNSLVVNMGDLLQRWSNNRFLSTMHCVRNTSGRNRYSIPVFFDPDTDAIIDPRDPNLPRNTSAKYEPVSAGEYIMCRNRESFSQYK